MSCYIIYYKDGAKMMRPVRNREEYVALRDSEQNRRAEKRHMVQMNYSCLPNAVEGMPEGCGYLKGATQMSNTVGMDIDLHRDDYANDDDYQKALEAIPETVMAKKEALGLLMMERSASKGYHIAFSRRCELTQEENLRWASELLGVEYDKGAKDITRVFFSPADKLLYVSDALFDNSAAAEDRQSADVMPDAMDGGESALQCCSATVEKLTYQDIPYASIIAKYWELFNDGKEPQEGDRNVKTYELAMTLRPICDYDMEKMLAVMPNYWAGNAQDGGQTTSCRKEDAEEYRKTIENALKEPRKGMPYRLRQVLLALKKESGVKATGGTMTTPPPMPKRLPKLIQLLTKNVPWYYKPAVSSAVFPALAAHLHGVKFRYWDNVEHEATFMNVLVGRQSVGKGCIKKPIDYIMADIKERDKVGRAREAEWKRNNPSGKTKPKDPRPADICIQMLIDNLTDAVFNQRVVDASQNGERYIYTIVDEIEALKKVTSRGTIDEVLLLIRKAFDNSLSGQERVGADSVCGIAPLRWNWNASTTPPNVRRFFSKGVSDGTISRLDVSTINHSDDDDEDPVIGIYDESFAKELKPYIDRLEAASGMIECQAALRLALQIKQENKDAARLYESEAYKVLSYRANVIAWLKGMLLYIAQGYKWDKTIADFVRWTEQYNLWCKMLYFGQQMEAELKEEDSIQRASGPQNLLDLLPNEFTRDHYLQMRAVQGKEGTGDSTLRTWLSRGYIVYDEVSQTYCKTESYLRRNNAQVGAEGYM